MQLYLYRSTSFHAHSELKARKFTVSVQSFSVISEICPFNLIWNDHLMSVYGPPRDVKKLNEMNQRRSVPSCLPEELKKVETFQPLLNGHWRQQTQCVGLYSSKFFDISSLTSSLLTAAFPSPSLEIWMFPVSRAGCNFNGLFTQTFTVFQRLFLGFLWLRLVFPLLLVEVLKVNDCLFRWSVFSQWGWPHRNRALLF